MRPSLVAALMAVGCTTVAYPGGRRDPASIATLVASNVTRINFIDGKQVRDDSLSGGRFELLPGFHSVGFSYYAQEGILIRTHKYGRNQVLCLNARPGYTYETAAVVVKDQWFPRILNERGRPVAIDCPARGEPVPAESVPDALQGGRVPAGSAAILAPRMSRQAFTRMFADALLMDEGVIYSSYALLAVSAAGRTFNVLATFEKDTLWRVELVDAESDDAGPDVSPTQLRRARTLNDEWLRNQLGEHDGTFPWGTVRSQANAKTGLPEISLLYR